MKFCKYCGMAPAIATTLSDEFCSDDCHTKWIQLPFSLCCQYCDAGSNTLTEQQAIGEGWIEIEADPGGLSWNFLGVCPDCIDEHNR